MSETWLPQFVRRDGPAWKQGYYGVPTRPLSLIEGDVKHSMEGPMAAGLGVLDGPRQASWHFSIPKVALPGGKLGYQHYPLESPAWHCGVAGDLQTETSLIGNITLVGIEHEGVAGETLTAHQINATVVISDYLRKHTYAGAYPPELSVNLWEHNWLSATACPSNRIVWTPIINELKRLEGEKDTVNLFYIRIKGEKAVWATNWQTKWHIPNTTTWKELARITGTATVAIDTTSSVVNSIPTVPHFSDAFWRSMTANGGRIRQWAAEGAKEVVDPHDAKIVKGLQTGVQAIINAIKAGDAADAEAIANELAARLAE